ncbi:hypothetical protein LTR85_007989 [Meristemomyces frigidus]|nr:hypothetical protein LTR85_007989 [Meristemomyces frigidus]
MGAHFKDDVVFPGLLIGGIGLSLLAFLGLATFPRWHEEHDFATGSDIDVEPFPSRPVSHLCMFLLGMASLFFLTGAMWQHVAAASAASMVSTTTQGYLSGHIGPAAMALAWTSFLLVAIAFAGLTAMVLSIAILGRLTDD